MIREDTCCRKGIRVPTDPHHTKQRVRGTCQTGACMSRRVLEAEHIREECLRELSTTTLLEAGLRWMKGVTTTRGLLRSSSLVGQHTTSRTSISTDNGGFDRRGSASPVAELPGRRKIRVKGVVGFYLQIYPLETPACNGVLRPCDRGIGYVQVARTPTGSGGPSATAATPVGRCLRVADRLSRETGLL